MKQIFCVLFILMFTVNLKAELVEVRLEESYKNNTYKFSFDTNKGLIHTKKSFKFLNNIEQLSKYSIKKEHLYFKSQKITDAEKILFQSIIGNKEILIISNTHYSISSPWKILRAVSGHPVPFIKIEILILKNGKRLKKDSLLRQESYGSWTATVWSQELKK